MHNMAETIKIAGTIGESIVDGPGFRYVIFTQGCPHHCPGCHNPQSHDFSGGTEMPIQTLIDDMLAHSFCRGVTFSGGEPFCQAEALVPIAQAAKAAGKHLMIYTGYTLEELLAFPDPAVRELLGYVDLLVDGRFVLEERSVELKFRGSANQRVLDVPASLAAEAPVWKAEYR